MTKAALAAGTALFGAALAAFARQPGLGTFADDSVSYLVMAQVFSPWQAAAAPVAEAFAREATYPPLFPFFLAVAGVAHDIAAAHVATALVLAACVVPLHFLAAALVAHRGAALAAVSLFAALPATWLQARGILSEPLFTLLLLALLALLQHRTADARGLALVAALLASLALTRTVGLVLAAAYAAWALACTAGPLRTRLNACLPALVAFAAYAAWMLLRPGETQDDYVRILREHASTEGPGLAATLARQARAMYEAWIGSLLIYWVEDAHPRALLAAAVGMSALAALGIRAWRGAPDAWLVGAYLATFLAWPFYDQMTRFIFPVVPVLVVYALWTGRAVLARLGRAPALGPALVTVLIASLTAPALAFMAQRAGAAGPQTRIIDWYRTPDRAQALRRAEVHLGLEADMEAIARLARPGERVMWVTPAYVALLADRHGVPVPREAPDALRARALRESDLVFISRFHPRDTVRDTAWRVMTAALRGTGEVVHLRRGADGEPAALLVRLAK